MLLTLGEKVKVARKKKKLTQQDLADLANVSRSFINHVEGNRKRPSLDTLKRFAQVLSVTLDYFIEDNVTIIKDDQLSESAIQKDTPNFLNYAVIIDKAIAKKITPEEIDKALDFIEQMKKQGH